MSQIFAIILVFVMPMVCLLLYVYFSRKIGDVRLDEFLVMVFISVIPLANLLVLVMLLNHVYHWGDLFDKTIFKQLGD